MKGTSPSQMSHFPSGLWFTATKYQDGEVELLASTQGKKPNTESQIARLTYLEVPLKGLDLSQGRAIEPDSTSSGIYALWRNQEQGNACSKRHGEAYNYRTS